MKLLYLSTIAYDHLRARPQWLCANFARNGVGAFYFDPPTLKTSLTWDLTDARIRSKVDEGGATITRMKFPRGVVIGDMKSKLPVEGRFQASFFEKTMRAEGIDPSRDAIIVGNPRYWGPVVSRLELGNLYYDCHDHWEVMSGAMSEADFMAIERGVVAKSRKVFVTSEYLREHIDGFGLSKEIVKAPNGIDYDALTKGWIDESSTAPARSGRPVIGLVGSIDHHWVNLELIERAAKARPDFDFVLVGPLGDPSPARKLLGGLPNVTLAGRAPYSEVGKWIRSFSIGMIPFNAGELARATEPIKAYEYMAFGVPVLAHQLPELEKFGDLITVTYKDEDFISKLDSMLALDTPEARMRRIEAAKANSWAARAATILDAIEGARP